MKPKLHFAHANGVPSPVYEPFLSVLRDQLEVAAISPLGATAGYPVDQNWKSLTSQVIDSVESFGGGQPVIGVGHSLGALCTYLAAHQRPDLFTRVIMLDPPMFVGSASFAMWVLKRLGNRFIDKLAPSGLSKKRRDHWPDREVAYESLRRKSLFRPFDERCFKAYIDHALVDSERGVELLISREAETEIFRTNPDFFWRDCRKPEVPVLQVTGSESDFFKRGYPQAFEKTCGIPYKVVAGGHMFIHEHPDQIAQLILSELELEHLP